jgi:hypothetical protein
MVLPDRFDEERKRTEATMHRSDIDQEVRELADGIHKVTHEISGEFKKVKDTRPGSPSDPAP